EEDGVDRQRLRLALFRGHVAAAALDADLHLQHAVLVEAGQEHVRREDLHVRIRLEVARLHGAGALRSETQDLGTVHVEREHDLAEVHHDVESVFDDTRQVRELVEDVLDLDPRRRRAVDGGQQSAPVGVADGQREAGLEQPDGELAVDAILDGPFVTGRELKLLHEDPLAELRAGVARPFSIPREDMGLRVLAVLVAAALAAAGATYLLLSPTPALQAGAVVIEISAHAGVTGVATALESGGAVRSAWA